MTVKKLAISLPVEVVREVDRAAAARGVTRSRFISEVLCRTARARRDAEITRRLDELFADHELADEQRDTSKQYLRLSRWK
jgi:metal-responsive CopG/Arc/MetJ family transcriptional regulator